MLLVYIPITSSPLQAEYIGPNKILGKLSEYNYITETPNRHKATQLVHINLLKPYKHQKSPSNPQILRPMLCVTRTLSSDSSVSVVENPGSLPTVQEQELTHIIPSAPLSNSAILDNLPHFLRHLSSTQQDDLNHILWHFSSVFNDNLGQSPCGLCQSFTPPAPPCTPSFCP